MRPGTGAPRPTRPSSPRCCAMSRTRCGAGTPRTSTSRTRALVRPAPSPCSAFLAFASEVHARGVCAADSSAQPAVLLFVPLPRHRGGRGLPQNSNAAAAGHGLGGDVMDDHSYFGWYRGDVVDYYQERRAAYGPRSYAQPFTFTECVGSCETPPRRWPPAAGRYPAGRVLFGPQRVPRRAAAMPVRARLSAAHRCACAPVCRPHIRRRHGRGR